jgi:antitoxin (DNA-binding transcriptional repressor) of toxin-antitoxin stability system
MQKKIGTDDMRKKMGEILDCVNLRGDEFIIERKQQPIAALVPLSKLRALTQMAKNYVVELISDHPAVDISQEAVDTLANEAKHKSRKKQRKA